MAAHEATSAVAVSRLKPVERTLADRRRFLVRIDSDMLLNHPQLFEDEKKDENRSSREANQISERDAPRGRAEARKAEPHEQNGFHNIDSQHLARPAKAPENTTSYCVNCAHDRTQSGQRQHVRTGREALAVPGHQDWG